jgi:DNA-binding NarL/FixJ family response regulator
MKTVDTLTHQEHIVLALVAKGWRNTQIATELVISIRTVENHLYHIFSKLGVSSRTEAAIFALRTGMTPTEMSGIPDDRKRDNHYPMNVSQRRYG